MFIASHVHLILKTITDISIIGNTGIIYIYIYIYIYIAI